MEAERKDSNLPVAWVGSAVWGWGVSNKGEEEKVGVAGSEESAATMIKSLY